MLVGTSKSLEPHYVSKARKSFHGELYDDGDDDDDVNL